VRLMDGRAESTELLNDERRRRAKLAWLSYETVFMSEAALAESWSLRRLAEGVSSDAHTVRLTHRCHTTINGCMRCKVKTASYSSLALIFSGTRLDVSES
jgi:hypothetical protein